MFPTFVLQQTRNSLAVRRLVPQGLEKTELVWTCFGFTDDDEAMTERRLRQANLIGPAGYISMEDGAAPGFVQRARQHRAGRALGGGDGRRERRLRRQPRHRGGGARLLEGLSRADGALTSRVGRRMHMDIELQLKVQDLNARYVQAIDDDQLEAWPDFFTEHGRYRVTTAENVAQGLPLGMIYATSRAMLRDRVRSLRDANVYEAQRYRHMIAPAGDRAGRGRRRARADQLHGRAHHAHRRDHAVRHRPLRGSHRARRTGAPRFAEKVVVLDSRLIDTLLAIPL